MRTPCLFLYLVLPSDSSGFHSSVWLLAWGQSRSCGPWLPAPPPGNTSLLEPGCHSHRSYCTEGAGGDRTFNLSLHIIKDQADTYACKYSRTYKSIDITHRHFENIYEGGGNYTISQPWLEITVVVYWLVDASLGRLADRQLPETRMWWTIWSKVSGSRKSWSLACWFGDSCCLEILWKPRLPAQHTPPAAAAHRVHM